MKNVYIFVVTAIISFSCNAQQLYRLQWENSQQVEIPFGAIKKEVDLPSKGIVVSLGGLNDLDGAGNYLNMYGNTLIIDSLDLLPDGSKKVVLRREDGRDFFNLFSTVKARLIPLERVKNSYLD